MRMYLILPAVVLVVLAFIRGFVPAAIAALAFLLCIGFNRIANSRSLLKRSAREIAERRSGTAQVLIYILAAVSVILMILSAVLLFRTYDWVVGVGFIGAIAAYFIGVSASSVKPN